MTFYTHTPPKHTPKNFFRGFFGKLYQKGKKNNHFEKWPSETILFLIKAILLDEIDLEIKKPLKRLKNDLKWDYTRKCQNVWNILNGLLTNRDKKSKM